MASAVEWAWLAGIIEGEGCIAFTGVNSIELRVNMTDFDVVKRCHTMTGVGQIVGPAIHNTNPKAKPSWGWQVARRDAVLLVLDRIEGHLGERRSQRAAEARARLANCRREGFCSKGHPMSGENLYVSPGGQRMCLTCRRGRDAARRPRLKT